MNEKAIHYSRIGSGMPILFVNALYQPRQTWEPIASRIARYGECILFDFPNQNLPTNGNRPDLSFDQPEAYEDYILEVLKTLNLKPKDVIACGLSSGANFLRHLHLERGIDFKKLVLMAIDPPDLSRFYAVFNAECLSLLEAAGVERYAGILNFWFYTPDWINKNEFVIKYIRNRYKNMFSDGDSIKALVRASAATYSRRPPEGAFHCPTSLITGQSDLFCPITHIRRYAQWAGAGFYSVAGAHSFPIENPAQTEEVMRTIMGVKESAAEAARVP